MTLEEKIEELNKIAKELAQTKGGPLKGPGINPVPGEGNADSKVIFIGEAPGFNENQLGRPFVGLSGKLLRKNLALNGIKESDVFITNIVKFRPPENRDPTPSEIEYFKPFLDRQIEVISPEIIVTLGRFSMYKFLGEGVSISKIHGQPRSIIWNGKSVTIYPMYHPAAALRQGAVMFQFEEDFRRLKSILNKATEKKIEENKLETPKKTEQEQLELI